MVIWIILLGIGFILVLSIIFFIKHWLFMNNLYYNFCSCNVITFGKKRSGKDLITHKVIKHRKEFYYANIPYTNDDNYEIVKLLDVSVYPNTYDNFVTQDLTKIKPRFKEGCDIYISDIGVYLPSYMDNKLYNRYPSMPILYALSGQLYCNNVHCNTQNLERAWKALREQADFYVWAVHTISFPFVLITKVVTYDKYDSAKQCLLPIKTRLLNKYSKAEVDLYYAQHGDIRQGHVIQLKKNITYDTRYFSKLLF